MSSAIEGEAPTNSAANNTQNHNNNSHSNNGSLSPPKERERNSLTLDQRRALRRWANSQTTRPSHKACIEWFQTQYNQTISQSTVSHSLSPKYARLDGDPQLSGSRLRFVPAGQDDPLTLTPIPSGGPVSLTDRPVRCPFCVNQRMLRTIKEAVEHLSTHVVV
ncbi:Homeodomain-like protein [Sordaria brevicollis]|uniref:Homeodomain-like protein n=1 Tax=Sordaria brevicollis TaxID=83679 RepID=A0AAE0PHN1_SORBR|nr:Homeodomain-like protein [Sordaria brevicollis]